MRDSLPACLPAASQHNCSVGSVQGAIPSCRNGNQETGHRQEVKLIRIATPDIPGLDAYMSIYTPAETGRSWEVSIRLDQQTLDPRGYTS